MKKAYRRLGFIVLVVFALVISGCVSAADPLKETKPTRAVSNSSAPKAGSTSAKAGGSAVSAKDSSAAKPGEPVRLNAANQKTWSKVVGFLKENWLFLLLILLILIVCSAVCRTVKRKVKKSVLTRNIIMASVVLVSLGLIFGVVYYGIIRHDGKFQRLRQELPLKRIEVKKTETKKTEAKATYARTNTYRLNFRQGPSVSHKIIRGLPRNTRVEVISDSGTWWKVKYENTEGYINSKYLRRE
jgi:uncharacterized protein YcfL